MVFLVNEASETEEELGNLGILHTDIFFVLPVNLFTRVVGDMFPPFGPNIVY